MQQVVVCLLHPHDFFVFISFGWIRLANKCLTTFTEMAVTHQKKKKNIEMSEQMIAQTEAERGWIFSACPNKERQR